MKTVRICMLVVTLALSGLPSETMSEVECQKDIGKEQPHAET
jgi:hypothetical protein